MNQLYEFRKDSKLSSHTIGKPIDHIHANTNSILKSTIISYFLEENAFVKIEIYSQEAHQKIKDLVFIPGNPGGRKGENKICWDGTSNLGAKVARGNYLLRFRVNNHLIFQPIAITFKKGS